MVQVLESKENMPGNDEYSIGIPKRMIWPGVLEAMIAKNEEIA